MPGPSPLSYQVSATARPLGRASRPRAPHSLVVLHGVTDGRAEILPFPLRGRHRPSQADAVSARCSGPGFIAPAGGASQWQRPRLHGDTPSSRGVAGSLAGVLSSLGHPASRPRTQSRSFHPGKEACVGRGLDAGWRAPEPPTCNSILRCAIV